MVSEQPVLVPANLLATISDVSWIATDHLHLQHRRTQVAPDSSEASSKQSRFCSILRLDRRPKGCRSRAWQPRAQLLEQQRSRLFLQLDSRWHRKRCGSHVAASVPRHGFDWWHSTTMLAGVHLVMFRAGVSAAAAHLAGSNVQVPGDPHRGPQFCA